jgi:hypothetical protein
MRVNIGHRVWSWGRSVGGMLGLLGGACVAGALLASWALSTRGSWSGCIIPRSQSARLQAQQVRHTVCLRALTRPRPCPTMDDLMRDRWIDRASSVADPWGRPWRISCQADDVIVSSDGPDGIEGTRDDIVAANPPP